MNSARLQDTRSIYKNPLYFYMLAMTNQKNEIKEIPFIIASKNNIILMNKFNKRSIILL